MSVQVNSVQADAIQAKPQPTSAVNLQNQPTLRIGDSGPAVEVLQQQLSLYVTPVPVDGIFSHRTHHALHVFQYSMFLTEDGVAGPKTWDALRSGLPADMPVLRVGDSGQAVIWLQQILARMGVYRAAGLGASVDGLFGPATEAAVRQYQGDQQRRGFVVDGIVGPDTWLVLSRDRLQTLTYPIYDIRQQNRGMAHTGSVSAIATISGIGDIFTGSTDTLLQRWDERGNQQGSPDFGDRGSVSDVVINPGTLDVVSSTFGGTIRTRDFRQTANSRASFPGRGGSVRAIDIPADGKVIAAGNTDKTLRLFDTDGKLLGEVNLHEDDVTGVAFNPRGERFGGQIISADTAQKVVASTLVFSDGRLDIGLRPFSVLSEASTGVLKSSVAISANGYYVAVAGGPTLRIFSALGGLLYSANYQVALNDVAFSPCGRYLALACGDRVIRVLDLFPPATGEGDIFVPLYTLISHSQSVESVAFSRDSAYLYSGAADGELVTWRIER